MDRNNIYIIHPADDTTDFLEEIINYLIEKTQVTITINYVESESKHIKIFEEISNVPLSNPIFFFGHGNSESLSGARNRYKDYGSLIKKDQLDCLKGRNVLLLSCRSSEYLKVFGNNACIKAGIGFPNLVTHKDDLMYTQNFEREKDITEYEIMLFRQIIIDTIMYSIEDFIVDSLSFYQLFKRIQMRVNRELIKYYCGSKSGSLQIGKMLNDMNDGMYFMGN